MDYPRFCTVRAHRCTARLVGGEMDRRILTAPLLLVATMAQVQAGSWSFHASTSAPSRRIAPATTYDATRGVVVLFGGMRGDGVHLNDTWEFDGASWQQVPTAHAPSPRRSAALAFDSQRGVTVLFGGSSGGEETWEYDGSDWRQVILDGDVPPGRWQHAMAFDPARHVVVLYGGAGYADTWEYTGSAWIRRFAVSLPGSRKGHTLVWNPTRSAIILVGGSDEPANTFGNLDDTWLYDGVDWARLPDVGSCGIRGAHSHFFDSAAAEEIVVSGRRGTRTSFEALQDMRSRSSGSWTVAANAHLPPASDLAGAAYMESASLAVLFGGRDAFENLLGQTWLYRSFCGNYLLDPGEECDDGNDINGDGCQSSCLPCAPADELCDGLDQACDGLIDDEIDMDNDGYVACSSYSGSQPGVVGGGDCDDRYRTVYPGAPPIACDHLNNDCTDPLWPAVPPPERDADQDGHAVCDGDCDDGDPRRYPTGVEVCDALDNDCDGAVDEFNDDPGDPDGDGIGGICDNCPHDFNADQLNLDGDRAGNACDNCLMTPNDDQSDLDADEVGDVCDNCQLSSNSAQADTDSDGRGDVCDNCVSTRNESQHDLDEDQEGDECDLDDGVVLFGRIGRPRVRWQSDPAYDSYSLYRGSLQVLRSTGEYTQEAGSNPYADRWCGLTVTNQDDPLVPAIGDAFYWLVAGRSASGEEPLGDGAGISRPNNNPCP